jgi:diguanylate cyclase (GGDEF)-like protein
MLRRRGESARAFAQIERAVEHAHAHGGSASLGELYELGSRICEEHGDLAPALEWFKRFHRVHREARGEVGRLRAQVLAVQWDLEKLSAAAASERARADELQEANQNLTDLAGRLERHALMDPLTGVANRRRLDQHLSAAHAEAVARGVPCCVALLDLDDFKLVNDRFSHAAGDGVLRRIGRLLANHRRASDLVARFGGEEFVIVFSDTDVRGAARVCERLRRRIEAEDWSSVVGGPSPVDGLVVTASFGVGDMAAHRDVSSGLAAVDALLYQAKAAGRNRVISAATAGP